MKYNPGNKVRIKSLDWYKANEYGGRVVCDGITFQGMMTEWCGKELTIDLVCTNDEGRSLYIMKEPKIQWRFTDGMIEGLADETEPQKKMVSPDKVCKWLRANIDLYADTRRSLFSNYQEVYLTDNFETEFRKAMEE